MTKRDWILVRACALFLSTLYSCGSASEIFLGIAIR